MKSDLRDDIYEFDVVIVGAGFFGMTLAYELSTRSNKRVLVIDKRNHMGGNAYSYTDPATNIEIHKYGSHLFHTSNLRVWTFVNKFSDFNSYIHRVKTLHENRVFSIPVNLHTISQFAGHYLGPEEARKWVEEQKNSAIESPKNLEEQAIKLVGKTLYAALFEGYTKKQWSTNPVELPADIISRIPIRFDFNDRYFSDAYEGVPTEGYGKLFENLRRGGNFELQLNTDFNPLDFEIPRFRKLVYTGPLDRFFDYRHGVLGWRTLDFEEDRLNMNDFQGTSVMNYADEKIPFTRIHEFKHLHPERSQSETSTIIFKEFSRFAGEGDEPYYPINSESDRTKLELYREEAGQMKNVLFGGRLGRYQYLDMHMAIASALSMADRILSDEN
jgi:UDP-galactopyranose mutase